jgi:hypothetical protein
VAGENMPRGNGFPGGVFGWKEVGEFGMEYLPLYLSRTCELCDGTYAGEVGLYPGEVGLYPVGLYAGDVGTYAGEVGLYPVGLYPVGLYAGEVELYGGEVGLYAGEVGLYAGEVGTYAGEVGLYAGEVGLSSSFINFGGDARGVIGMFSSTNFGVCSTSSEPSISSGFFSSSFTPSIINYKYTIYL